LIEKLQNIRVYKVAKVDSAPPVTLSTIDIQISFEHPLPRKDQDYTSVPRIGTASW